MIPFTLKEGGFGVGDYIVFVVLCLSSCAGGIWYSAKSSKMHKVKDVTDYLLGGKAMSTFPVAMSLIASYVSGVTILGTPAEVYNYGSQYYLVIVGVTLSCIIVANVYIPVFSTLRCTSSYEYLELRFHKRVRFMASLLFLLDEILFLPMVVYVPALAFNQLTGFNVYGVGGIMVLICGLYTALGGLKAVVWTDSVQTGIMFIGVFLVSLSATIAVGGFKPIYNSLIESDRLHFNNWSFSPYERQTGWGAIFGGMIYWTCFNSVNQTMVQRYIALSSKKKAVKALAIFCVGAILAITLCVWCGLAAWAAWATSGCDPGGKPVVDDRLLPAFVTYIVKVQNLPGLAGVFLAGVFGAGLSSMSAVLNACALVVIEDLIHGSLDRHLKPLTEGLIARVVTAFLAMFSVVMLVIISKLGGVLGVATALSAIAASTTCGVFTLGMVCWWVGPRGALAGALAGALVAGTTSLGSAYAAAHGLRSPPLPPTPACAVNATYTGDYSTIDPSTVFPLFRLSYHWIAPLGFFTTLLVGIIVGWLFDKRSDLRLDAELFSPVVRRWLPDELIANSGTVRRTRNEELGLTASPLILGAMKDKIIKRENKEERK